MRTLSLFDRVVNNALLKTALLQQAHFLNGYKLESGLNDYAIELLKRVALYNKMPEGLPANTEFRFGGVFPEQGDKQLLLFHCVSDHLKEGKVMNIPFSAYEDIAKDAIADKIFEQDADFPEVSQWFLEKSLKE